MKNYTTQADSSIEDEDMIVPKKYSILTNSDIYAIGDSVLVNFQLPKSSRARVWIEKD